MRRFCLVSALLFACAVTLPQSATSASNREVGDLGRVGTVDFPTSCDPAVQEDFERGLALLHSFFYEEARRVFEDVARRDPDCAMAHWGVAMTYYHPLWTAPGDEEMAAGTAAVERALAASKQSPRETAYVRAIEAYYKGVDSPETEAVMGEPSCHGMPMPGTGGRAACFMRGMRDVATDYPDDVDAAAFYALSLVATAPPADPMLANQAQAGAMLEELYEERPDHPGLAHYIIHSYDYPPTASKALRAAQEYAAIAPWVPHALHMPSHIFTRLGMWDETIESNLASAAAARAYEAEHHPGAASSEELHALDYLVYGYLQTAQDAKAAEVLARLGSMKKTFPESDFAVAYAAGAIPARYALERRDWKQAASLEKGSVGYWNRFPFAEGHIAYARAVGAARLKDRATAEAAAKRLGELSAAATDPRFRYFAEQMETQRQAALALVDLSQGESERAIAKLRSLAAREDSLGKHPVSPGSILPIRELLAEALLDAGRPNEAIAEYDASLKIYPGRFGSIYGAGRAAEVAGNKAEARKRYEQLVKLAAAGDDRPELAHAEEFLAGR